MRISINIKLVVWFILRPHMPLKSHVVPKWQWGRIGNRTRRTCKVSFDFQFSLNLSPNPPHSSVKVYKLKEHTWKLEKQGFKIILTVTVIDSQLTSITLNLSCRGDIKWFKRTVPWNSFVYCQIRYFYKCNCQEINSKVSGGHAKKYFQSKILKHTFLILVEILHEDRNLLTLLQLCCYHTMGVPHTEMLQYCE